VGVAVLLLVAGGLLVYSSPYSLQPSDQTTEAEIAGMTWFVESKDRSVASAGWNFDPSRFVALKQGYDESNHRWDTRLYVAESWQGMLLPLPLHLGYDRYGEMREAAGRDVYVVVSERTRGLYRDVYPQLAGERLTEGDLGRMGKDGSLSKVYTNGDVEVWVCRE
jgi:hypothetical protein